MVIRSELQDIIITESSIQHALFLQIRTHGNEIALVSLLSWCIVPAVHMIQFLRLTPPMVGITRSMTSLTYPRKWQSAYIVTA